MPRWMLSVVRATLALFLASLTISVVYDAPGQAVWAQGPLGRKQTGDDEEKRREEARKEEARREDARRQEEQRRQEQEARRQEELRRQEEDRRRAEEARRQEEARRAEERRQREEARRREEARQEEDARREEARRREETSRHEEARRREEARLEDERRRAEAARPSYHPETRSPDASEFKRVGERPPARRERHRYRPLYYPYDPQFVVIEVPVRRDPVVIAAPGPEPEPEVSRQPAPEPQEAVVLPPAPEDKPDEAVEAPSDVAEKPVTVPATPEAALAQIRLAWLERDPKLLVPLLPESGEIKVYKEGSFSHSLSPEDFYALTAEAMEELTTEVFWLSPVKKEKGKVLAGGVHAYRANGEPASRSEITYTLELRAGRWVITETGFTPTVQARPAGRALGVEEAMKLLVRAAPVSAAWILPEPAASVIFALALLPQSNDQGAEK